MDELSSVTIATKVGTIRTTVLIVEILSRRNHRVRVDIGEEITGPMRARSLLNGAPKAYVCDVEIPITE